MDYLAKLDQKYVWHPFTQMKDWMKEEPIVIESGKGAILRDTKGREYIDANASIWTNLHGHNHPRINRAVEKQLKKIAHSSALGLANEPASQLAERLVRLANPKRLRLNASKSAQSPLAKVFFSDDGSTAMEVALKLSYEFARRTGLSKRPRFLSLQDAYHGDTVGAVSLGHLDLFHKAYKGLLFKSDSVMSPYCYRCPFNRAKPERAEATTYRRCRWECVSKVERAFEAQKKKDNPYAAMVVEPKVQGVMGMIVHPPGWLKKVAGIARAFRAQLIADEVMTGFGRTGGDGLFASHLEDVQPDFLALAKGMTGGCLPMAATLVTQEVFDAFLGDYEEFKTFFHGHSYTSNQLGAAASLASLELLDQKKHAALRKERIRYFHGQLEQLWDLPQVGDVRRIGMIAGVELVRDWTTREPFDIREQRGIRVCKRMAQKGVLTRPIGNVIVLMLPFCATKQQIRKVIQTVYQSIEEELGPKLSDCCG